MCINAVLVASMGVGNGFTGVFSLGHVGFVAVGAYASGILSLPLAPQHAHLSDLPHWLRSFSPPFLPAAILAGAPPPPPPPFSPRPPPPASSLFFFPAV